MLRVGTLKEQVPVLNCGSFSLASERTEDPKWRTSSRPGQHAPALKKQGRHRQELHATQSQRALASKKCGRGHSLRIDAVGPPRPAGGPANRYGVLRTRKAQPSVCGAGRFG